MSLRDNPETERIVRELVDAVAHDDYAKANAMVREYTTTPDDQFMVILLTARIAAEMPHAAAHFIDGPISPYLGNKTGPEVVAMQIISLFANHSLDTAFDLATATVHIGNVNPAHVQGVVKALVEMAAHADHGIVLVAEAADATGPAPDRMGDPRLN